MIVNLVEGIDVPTIEAKIAYYQKENAEQIMNSQARKAEEYAAALAASKGQPAQTDVDMFFDDCHTLNHVCSKKITIRHYSKHPRDKLQQLLGLRDKSKGGTSNLSGSLDELQHHVFQSRFPILEGGRREED